MDACLVAGSLTACQAGAKNRECSVQEGLADACHFPKVLSEMLEALSPFPRGTLAKLYTLVVSTFQGD